MIKYSKGQNISINLTLINNDGNPEDNADVSYNLYDDKNNLLLSNSELPFNEQLGSYVDVIDPLLDWPDQEEGIYYINWIIENTTEDYPNTVTEELYIHDYNNKLDKILGLVHQNIYIDQTEYDKYDNLKSARLTIYKDSESVGTNENILGRYRIESHSDHRGTFTYWKQTEIE